MSARQTSTGKQKTRGDILSKIVRNPEVYSHDTDYGFSYFVILIFRAGRLMHFFSLVVDGMMTN